MRTKALICAAVLTAAGVASSMAQVYSVNAVGYVKVTVPNGFAMICNPLDAGAGNNTIGKLMPAATDGTIVYQYVNGVFGVNTFDALFGGWTDPNAVVEPGGGFFIFSQVATNVTFVGEVKQGNLQTPIPAGFSIRSSQVPQAGKLTADLGYPASDGDQVFTFVSGAYVGYTFDALFGGWTPSDPQIEVGQSFWVTTQAAKSWDRTFSVNTP